MRIKVCTELRGGGSCLIKKPFPSLEGLLIAAPYDNKVKLKMEAGSEKKDIEIFAVTNQKNVFVGLDRQVFN